MILWSIHAIDIEEIISLICYWGPNCKVFEFQANLISYRNRNNTGCMNTKSCIKIICIKSQINGFSKSCWLIRRFEYRPPKIYKEMWSRFERCWYIPRWFKTMDKVSIKILINKISSPQFFKQRRSILPPLNFFFYGQDIDQIFKMVGCLWL